MPWEGRIVGWFTILVGVATAAGPGYVAYDIASRGSIPEKQLELTQTKPFSVTEISSFFARRVTLVMTVGDDTYDNLVVGSATFRNIGRAPILPTDYFQPLTVSVEKPWKIVTVDSQQGLGLTWKRVDDQHYVAAPVLLNPDDAFGVNVYLTNTKVEKGNHRSENLDASIMSWSVRIANLRSLTLGADKFAELSEGFRFVVDARTAALGIALSAVFQAFYLYMMSASGMLQRGGWSLIWKVLLTGALSAMVAGGIGNYIFTEVVGAKHWWNASPIVLHVLFVIWLIVRWRQVRQDSKLKV